MREQRDRDGRPPGRCFFVLADITIQVDCFEWITDWDF